MGNKKHFPGPDLRSPNIHFSSDQERKQDWPDAIKARRPLTPLSLFLSVDCNDRDSDIPDILILRGTVGINPFDLRLDKHYAAEIKATRIQEFNTICELFVQQIEKATQEVKGDLPLSGLKVEAPVSSFENWLAAIDTLQAFQQFEIRLSEIPHSQRIISPDIVHLEGSVGGKRFGIKLDKFYEDETKLRLKAQMLRVAERYWGEIKKATTFPYAQKKDSK